MLKTCRFHPFIFLSYSYATVLEMNLRARGTIGEEIASSMLAKKGYRIVQRNFTVRGGEIDIIALKNGRLIFVEVKTRWNEKFGTGLESIDTRKQRRILQAAYEFISRSGLKRADFCIHIVDILLEKGSDSIVKIDHIEDVEF